MRIQVVETKTQRPLTNFKVQLQIKGKDSGFLSLTTDAQGFFELEDKYRGQQIAHYLQGKNPSQWITATDNAKLLIDATKESVREKTGSTTGSSSGGQF